LLDYLPNLKYQQMHVPVEQTLIQNTKFRAVLVFGVMCTLVALVLRAIVN